MTALAFDAQGRLLAGSEPNGILYRVTAPGKAFVLYDSSCRRSARSLPRRMEPSTRRRWAAASLAE